MAKDEQNVPVEIIGQRARAVSRHLAHCSTEQKNAALLTIADELSRCAAEILAANARDVEAAHARAMPAAFIDRLMLTPQRLQTMANDIRAVAALPDPVGEIFDAVTLPNGLRLHKRRIPLGVLAVIYEARPNVTTDIAALALKSGNAVILRGGSDNIHSNLALVGAIHSALARTGLPADAVQLIADTDRARVLELLRLHAYVDLVIPRGGESLHRFCRENSTIPVITGGMGINHIYVDPSAELDKAVEVVFNAKVSKPTVCNALGTLLVHAQVANTFLPMVAERLAEKQVELRCDARALGLLDGRYPWAKPADDASDWDTEWLGLILGVRLVDSLDEAIAFIQAHSLEHSDGICARDPQVIERFVNQIDSSAVFVNASTRFNDGGQFGLGAEVAISTQRVHARGPMGLRELTSYKWVCEGDGHVR
ncbi:MAG: glutamate-5-semialdehyde dehydrogenase, partial [Anaerolineae bacterium]|nr:glutamate-5-semialdehyde dehydrogenase [Anaerolineae bacterium]